MSNPLKRFAHRQLARTALGPLRDLYRVGALRDSGWFRSMMGGRPVDANGDPLIWITYPAIDFLRRRLPHVTRVFEYGAGASTLWWSSRAGHITSVEHDAGWYEQVRARCPANVTLRHHPLDDAGGYPGTITSAGDPFDVIVIDGRQRVACARRAPEHLTDKGVIIWDNAERGRYEPGREHLAACGFRSVEFWGLAPCTTRLSCTAIYYRDGNLLGL